MLEQKDLQAITEMIQGMEAHIGQKLEEQKREIMSETRGLLAQQKDELQNLIKAEISTAEQRIAKSTVALMDAEFSHRFNLLAENQQIMLEKLERLDDMEVMDTRITALEAMVKKLNREMEKLKKAQ